MLYLDSSVLVKRYAREAGSGAVVARFGSGEQIFTSAITYPEVLTALGRKYQAGILGREAWQETCTRFEGDWSFSFHVLDVGPKTLHEITEVTARYPLKAADAVHLVTALWLRDRGGLSLPFEFGVSDRSLARIAVQCGLTIFNPETFS